MVYGFRAILIFTGKIATNSNSLVSDPNIVALKISGNTFTGDQHVSPNNICTIRILEGDQQLAENWPHCSTLMCCHLGHLLGCQSAEKPGQLLWVGDRVAKWMRNIWLLLIVAVGLLIKMWSLSTITAGSPMVGTPINQVWRLNNLGLMKGLILPLAVCGWPLKWRKSRKERWLGL